MKFVVISFLLGLCAFKECVSQNENEPLNEESLYDCKRLVQEKERCLIYNYRHPLCKKWDLSRCPPPHIHRERSQCVSYTCKRVDVGVGEGWRPPAVSSQATTPSPTATPTPTPTPIRILPEETDEDSEVEERWMKEKNSLEKELKNQRQKIRHLEDQQKFWHQNTEKIKTQEKTISNLLKKEETWATNQEKYEDQEEELRDLRDRLNQQSLQLAELQEQVDSVFAADQEIPVTSNEPEHQKENTVQVHAASWIK